MTPARFAQSSSALVRASLVAALLSMAFGATAQAQVEEGAPVPFPESGGMTQPVFLSGPTPQYTREAVEHRIEGVLVARCRVGVDGSVSHCEVLEHLPYLDDAAVTALQSRRYAPLTYEGKPREVKFDFTLHFHLTSLPTKQPSLSPDGGGGA